MALGGTLHPLPASGLDPHPVISFAPEPAEAQHLADASATQHAEQVLDADWVLEDEEYDMRIGDKRKRDALAASAHADRGAADGGKQGGPKKAKGQAGGGKEKAAKPAGTLPAGWRCVRKTHTSGQKAGQHYKVYVSPVGKQHLSYAAAQADFARKPPKPRHSENLPLGWQMLTEREGGRTYIGPEDQHIRSWSGLMEHLAASEAEEAGPDSASAEAEAGTQQGEPRSGGSGSAAQAQDNADTPVDMRPLAAWLCALAREVQHGHCDLGAEERLFAQRISRLRLALLRHE